MQEKYSKEKAQAILESESPLNAGNKNQLRTVLPYYWGLKEWPLDIGRDTPAGVVFGNLHICFLNAKNVSEGVLGDFVGGFKISGIPERITMDGIKDLVAKDYLTLRDVQGTNYTGNILPTVPVKVGYTKKFLGLLLDKSGDGAEVGVEEKVVKL